MTKISFLYTLCLVIFISLFVAPISYAQIGAPTISLSADKYQVISGESVTVTWSTTNTSTCSAHDNWSGHRNTSGSYTSKPPFSAKFTLKCWNSAGLLTTESIFVSVGQIQMPQLNISASQTSINKGDSSLITWSSTDTDRCIASGGFAGNYLSSGSISVAPQNTTSYTLSCSNSLYKTSKSITVFVINGVGQTSTSSNINSNTLNGAIDITISANPQIIFPGQSAKISWGAVNVSACYGGGAWTGTKPAYGNEFVSPTNSTNYTLTCSNGNNIKTVTATVTVSNSSAYYPTPTPNSQTGYNNLQNKTSLVFSASPAIIKSGYTSTLKWQSNNTTSCIATGGWQGVKPANGVEYVWPNSQTNYTLTCYGETGSTYASALVSIEKTATDGSVSNLPKTSPTPTKTPIGSSGANSGTYFNAICDVNKNTAEVGEEVLFSARAIGGTAPYSYVWAGAISKIGDSQKISFRTVGTKIVTLTISDNLGKRAFVNCATKILPRSLNGIGKPTTSITPSAQNSDEIHNNNSTTSSKITLPNGEILSVSGSCELTNIVMCSDGRVYNLNDIASAGNTENNTSVASSSNMIGSSTNITSKNSMFASLFIGEESNFSWFRFFMILYVILITLAGILVITFRIRNQKVKKIDY